MATDIAFALGVIALLGSRVPLSLKVFLASLAIIDDLGALLVIAIFYTENISTMWLGVGGAVVVSLVFLNLTGTRPWGPYVLLGAVLWYALYKSGVHATIAGVLVAMTIPATSRVDGDEFLRHSRDMLARFERGGASGKNIITNQKQQSAIQAIEVLTRFMETPLQRLEHRLLPWVTFLIVPLFALSNAGVGFAGGGEATEIMPTAAQWGIGFGLVVGKPLGIVLATWIAVRSGLGTLPPEITWRHVVGLGFMAGIGFTMALFIAGLAYPMPQMLAEAKVAILGASLVAGIAGFVLLWTSRPAEIAAVDPEA
jgi:Na+:H+ antiporter, NhaA family